MYQIVGAIEGLAPILFNRMVDDLEAESTKGRVSKEDRMKEVQAKLYVDNKGVYYTGWALKQCLLEGCKLSGLKVGRRSLYSFLAATVFFPHQMYFRDKTEADFIHEHWGRRPPRTGGAMIIRRPALDTGWKLDFTLNVMDDRRTPEEIRRSLDEGGLLVGIGSWRPEYGRFIVTEWEVITNGNI